MRRLLDILLACVFLLFTAVLLIHLVETAIKFGLNRLVLGGMGFVAIAAFFSVGAVRILRVAFVRPKFHRAWAAARAGVHPDKWGVSAAELWAETEAKGGWGPTATLTFTRAIVEGSDELALDVLNSALSEPGKSTMSDIDLHLQAALYFALERRDSLSARRHLDQANAIPRRWFVTLIERDYHHLAEAAVLLAEGKKDAAARVFEGWCRRFGRARGQVRSVNAWAVEVMLREARPQIQAHPA